MEVNSSRKFKFFRVENQLIDREDVSHYEMLIYMTLCRYADNSTGKCHPSLRIIAKKIGSTRPTVIKYLKELEKKGFIKITKNGKTNYANNIYTILGIQEDEKEKNEAKKDDEKEVLPGKGALPGGKRGLPGVVKEVYQGGKGALPGVVKEFNTKKTNIKKTYKKDYNHSEKKSPSVKKQNKIPYQKIIDSYNRILGSKLNEINIISQTRKKKIKSRWKNGLNTLDNWEKLFKKVSESDFLTGKTSDWKATIDWLIQNDNNYVKVLEGNYKNNKSQKNNNGFHNFESSKDYTNAELERKLGINN